MLGIAMNNKPTKTAASMMAPRFTCKHCTHGFSSETRYIQHKCKQMKRAEELQTPIGQAAWSYYQQWMRSHKRMPPPSSSFLSSKYFRTFINFATHVQQVNLPHPDKFMWLMKERNIPPTIWTTNDVYSLFLEHIDRVSSPLEQAKLSIDTLLNIADKAQVQVDDVFNVITLNDVIQLLRLRRLSPWLLLNSKKFKQMYKETASSEQRIIIDTVIRGDYWIDKFQQFPKELLVIRQYVSELNI